MSWQIGILLYPRFTQLDAMGPFEVFSRLPGADVHLIAKTLDPVRSDTGLRVLPTMTLNDVPELHVICVPGGPGQSDHMDDEEILSFLATQSATAQFVTSVCTGAHLLGAAGALEGYEATTHWAAHDDLAQFGAKPVRQRVVRDRNRITGGGVTAGIDFALIVAAELAGDMVAQAIQLGIEYDPAPPFDAGSPEKAPAEVVEVVRSLMSSSVERRNVANRAAAIRRREAQ